MITSIEELQQTIYDAAYSVIRIGKEPTLAAFLGKTLKQTWSQQQTPAANPKLWWDSVALAIQNALRDKGHFWDGLSGTVLKTMHDEDKTWADAVQAALDSLVSLGTLDNPQP